MELDAQLTDSSRFPDYLVTKRNCEWCSGTAWMQDHFPALSEKLWYEWPHDVLLDLLYCQDCVLEYHRIKDELLVVQPHREKALWKADVERLTHWITRALNGIRVQLQPSASNSVQDVLGEVEIQHLEPTITGGMENVGKLLVPVQEILHFPRLLFDHCLAGLFVRAFQALNHASQLSINDKLPGVYLLLIHPNPQVRRWCERAVNNLEPLSADDFDNVHVKETIQWVVKVSLINLFENITLFHEGFTLLPSHLIPVRRAYWLGLCRILSQLDDEAVRVKLFGVEGCRELPITIMNTIRGSVTEGESTFWPALRCLVIILERYSSRLWSLLHPATVFDVITGHQMFKEEMKKFEAASVSMFIKDEGDTDTIPPQRSQSSTRSLPTSSIPKTALGWFGPFVISLLDYGDVMEGYISNVIRYLHQQASKIPRNRISCNEVLFKKLDMVHVMLRKNVKTNLLRPTGELWVEDLVRVAVLAKNAVHHKVFLSVVVPAKQTLKQLLRDADASLDPAVKRANDEALSSATSLETGIMLFTSKILSYLVTTRTPPRAPLSPPPTPPRPRPSVARRELSLIQIKEEATNNEQPSAKENMKKYNSQRSGSCVGDSRSVAVGYFANKQSPTPSTSKEVMSLQSDSFAKDFRAESPTPPTSKEVTSLQSYACAEDFRAESPTPSTSKEVVSLQSDSFAKDFRAESPTPPTSKEVTSLQSYSCAEDFRAESPTPSTSKEVVSLQSDSCAKDFRAESPSPSSPRKVTPLQSNVCAVDLRAESPNLSTSRNVMPLESNVMPLESNSCAEDFRAIVGRNSIIEDACGSGRHSKSKQSASVQKDLRFVAGRNSIEDSATEIDRSSKSKGYASVQSDSCADYFKSVVAKICSSYPTSVIPSPSPKSAKPKVNASTEMTSSSSEPTFQTIKSSTQENSRIGISSFPESSDSVNDPIFESPKPSASTNSRSKIPARVKPKLKRLKVVINKVDYKRMPLKRKRMMRFGKSVKLRFCFVTKDGKFRSVSNRTPQRDLQDKRHLSTLGTQYNSASAGYSTSRSAMDLSSTSYSSSLRDRSSHGESERETTSSKSSSRKTMQSGFYIRGTSSLKFINDSDIEVKHATAERSIVNEFVKDDAKANARSKEKAFDVGLPWLTQQNELALKPRKSNKAKKKPTSTTSSSVIQQKQEVANSIAKKSTTSISSSEQREEVVAPEKINKITHGDSESDSRNSSTAPQRENVGIVTERVSEVPPFSGSSVCTADAEETVVRGKTGKTSLSSTEEVLEEKVQVAKRGDAGVAIDPYVRDAGTEAGPLDAISAPPYELEHGKEEDLSLVSSETSSGMRSYEAVKVSDETPDLEEDSDDSLETPVPLLPKRENKKKTSLSKKDKGLQFRQSLSGKSPSKKPKSRKARKSCSGVKLIFEPKVRGDSSTDPIVLDDDDLSLTTEKNTAVTSSSKAFSSIVIKTEAPEDKQFVPLEIKIEPEPEEFVDEVDDADLIDAYSNFEQSAVIKGPFSPTSSNSSEDSVLLLAYEEYTAREGENGKKVNRDKTVTVKAEPGDDSLPGSGADRCMLQSVDKQSSDRNTQSRTPSLVLDSPPSVFAKYMQQDNSQRQEMPQKLPQSMFGNAEAPIKLEYESVTPAYDDISSESEYDSDVPLSKIWTKRLKKIDSPVKSPSKGHVNLNAYLRRVSEKGGADITKRIAQAPEGKEETTTMLNSYEDISDPEDEVFHEEHDLRDTASGEHDFDNGDDTLNEHWVNKVDKYRNEELIKTDSDLHEPHVSDTDEAPTALPELSLNDISMKIVNTSYNEGDWWGEDTGAAYDKPVASSSGTIWMSAEAGDGNEDDERRFDDKYEGRDHMSFGYYQLWQDGVGEDVDNVKDDENDDVEGMLDNQEVQVEKLDSNRALENSDEESDVIQEADDDVEMPEDTAEAPTKPTDELSVKAQSSIQSEDYIERWFPSDGDLQSDDEDVLGSQESAVDCIEADMILDSQRDEETSQAALWKLLEEAPGSSKDSAMSCSIGDSTSNYKTQDLEGLSGSESGTSTQRDTSNQAVVSLAEAMPQATPIASSLPGRALREPFTEPPAILESTRTLADDGLLYKMLSWKVTMLEDRAAAPKIEDNGRIPKTFDSIDQYVDVFVPLLEMEAVDQVLGDHGKNERKKPILQANVDSASRRGLYTFVDCTVNGVAEDLKLQKLLPAESDLVALADGVSRCFGIVENVDYDEVRRRHSSCSESDMASPSKTFNLTIKLRVRAHFRPDAGVVMEIKFVTSILTMLRQWKGLVSFKKSLLARDILRPRGEQFFCSNEIPKIVSANKVYNESQERVIATAAEAVHQSYALPRINLTQGPPGTGKSHTIVGMITRIFNHPKNLETDNLPSELFDKTRILLCAPSNEAVDELVRKILKAMPRKEKGNSNKENVQGEAVERPNRRDSIPNNCGDLLLVRLGPRFNESIKSYAFENIVREQMKRQGGAGGNATSVNVLKKQLHRLDVDLDKLDKEHFRLKEELKNETSVELEQMLTDVKAEKERLAANRVGVDQRLRKQKKKAADERRMQTRIRKDILLRADIVCCTLSGSGSRTMQDILGSSGKKIPFSCVIIDEACQCCEIDILIPLQYKPSKLILVGDPEQLPATVLSQRAKELLYPRSMFDRLYKFFKVMPRNQRPVHLLNMQYRMHPDISKFPSEHVYNNAILNYSSVETRPFPIKVHYALFDAVRGREINDNRGGIWNAMEADLVSNLCREIITKTPVTPNNIGVITPYRKQLVEIERRLHHFANGERIEVKTVDGFQGREKDVIIISCVRASHRSGGRIGFLADKNRLNVCLTRAKHALYVLGHMSTLQGADDDWKALVHDACVRKAIYKVSSMHDICRVLFGSVSSPSDSSHSESPRDEASGSSGHTSSNEARGLKRSRSYEDQDGNRAKHARYERSNSYPFHQRRRSESSHSVQHNREDNHHSTRRLGEIRHEDDYHPEGSSRGEKGDHRSIRRSGHEDPHQTKRGLRDSSREENARNTMPVLREKRAQDVSRDAGVDARSVRGNKPPQDSRQKTTEPGNADSDSLVCADVDASSELNPIEQLGATNKRANPPAGAGDVSASSTFVVSSSSTVVVSSSSAGTVSSSSGTVSSSSTSAVSSFLTSAVSSSSTGIFSPATRARHLVSLLKRPSTSKGDTPKKRVRFSEVRLYDGMYEETIHIDHIPPKSGRHILSDLPTLPYSDEISSTSSNEQPSAGMTDSGISNSDKSDSGKSDSGKSDSGKSDSGMETEEVDMTGGSPCPEICSQDDDSLSRDHLFSRLAGFGEAPSDTSSARETLESDETSQGDVEEAPSAERGSGIAAERTVNGDTSGLEGTMSRELNQRDAAILGPKQSGSTAAERAHKEVEGVRRTTGECTLSEKSDGDTAERPLNGRANSRARMNDGQKSMASVNEGEKPRARITEGGNPRANTSGGARRERTSSGGPHSGERREAPEGQRNREFGDHRGGHPGRGRYGRGPGRGGCPPPRGQAPGRERPRQSRDRLPYIARDASDGPMYTDQPRDDGRGRLPRLPPLPPLQPLLPPPPPRGHEPYPFSEGPQDRGPYSTSAREAAERVRERYPPRHGPGVIDVPQGARGGRGGRLRYPSDVHPPPDDPYPDARYHPPEPIGRRHEPPDDRPRYPAVHLDHPHRSDEPPDRRYEPPRNMDQEQHPPGIPDHMLNAWQPYGGPRQRRASRVDDSVVRNLRERAVNVAPVFAPAAPRGRRRGRRRGR